MVQEVEIIKKVKDVLVPSKKSHKVIVGGRGKGASWSIARVALLKGMQNSIFIPCIREYQKSLKHSVKKLLSDTIKHFNWGNFYRVYDNEIRGVNGTTIIFNGLRDFNADSIKSLEDAKFCWVAEAQSITRKSIEILRPTIRAEGSETWYDLNPRYATDPVYMDYVVNRDDDAEVIWLNWRDNPWLTDKLRKQKDSDFARNEQAAKHIWEGVLLDLGEMYICPFELVHGAMTRATVNHVNRYDITVGADIAHQGGDEIVFVKRSGNVTLDWMIMQKDFGFMSASITAQILQQLKSFMGDRSVVLNIDNGHIGAAIADLMEDDGYVVNRINFGGTAFDEIHYYDCVTEMYANFRDKLPYIVLPNNEELMRQLTQRKYKHVTGRRGYEVIKIENKQEFKDHAENVNNSPDRGDAFVMAYYEREDMIGRSGIATANVY
jgi:PBSX family phage terminase large subunit